MVTESTRKGLEKHRDKAVSKAEKDAGIRDGAIYRIDEPDGSFRWVRASAASIPGSFGGSNRSKI
jgi:hypothetical protein